MLLHLLLLLLALPTSRSLALLPSPLPRRAFLSSFTAAAFSAAPALAVLPPISDFEAVPGQQGTGAKLDLNSTAFAVSDLPPISDFEVVAGQQATGEKLDLNSAFVTDYKQLRGMYPRVAGKIASHGP